MNCKKCGNILQPTDTVCKYCGEPVMTTTETQVETNNNITPNPVGGMTFMTPPTEPQTSQNQQPALSNPEQTVAPVQGPVQQVNPEPSSNVVEQPVTQPQMALNQNINNQMGGMPTNGQSPVTQQQPTIQPMTNTLQVNSFAQTQATGATIQDESAEPTKKKNSPILVAILVIALIGIVGFEIIYFVKPFDKKNNNTDTNTTNSNNQEAVTSEENDNYANWMNYLLNQNITKITLERMPEDGSGNKKAPLMIDNLKTIFEGLEEYSLVKKYLEGAGFTGGDKLTISYAKADNNYEVIIANDMLFADNVSLKDEDLRNALEESEHTTENEELKDKEGVFYNYIFKNFDSTIYDEFFITEKAEENQ